MDRSNIKILLVNDKIDLRDIIRDYLRQDGYKNLSISEDGRSALRKIAADSPDLIIADYNLPGLSGVELLREVRRDRTLGDIPFILISSEADRRYVAMAAESGVSAFLVKPFTHQVLAEKAERLLNDKLNPPESHVHYHEANRLAKAGALEAAIEKYEEALASTKGTLAAIHYKVGRLHEQMLLEDDAEEDYLEALSMSDHYVRAYDAMGVLAGRRRGSEAALSYFIRGAEISPLNAQRQLRLGEALLETGRDEEAEKAFKYALELDPTQTHAFNRIAVALRRQSKLAEAETYFLKAIEADEGDENLYYNLSRVYIDQGRKPEAVAKLEKALELNPEFVEAREMLDRIKSAPAA
jgi:two-component system chemotaxis response regulator CheY